MDQLVLSLKRASAPGNILPKTKNATRSCLNAAITFHSLISHLPAIKYKISDSILNFPALAVSLLDQRLRRQTSIGWASYVFWLYMTLRADLLHRAQIPTAIIRMSWMDPMVTETYMRGWDTDYYDVWCLSLWSSSAYYTNTRPHCSNMANGRCIPALCAQAPEMDKWWI